MPLDPPVDSVLVVGFGGPESAADVVPFLRRVASGRDIPPERLHEVERHYLEVFGGVSPVNAQTRELAAALEQHLAGQGAPLPVYTGFRNAAPLLPDALSRLARDRRRHSLVLLMSAYPSYSGCRQYQDELARAAAAVPGAPRLTRLRHYYAEPGFLDEAADNVARALAEHPPGTPVAFTAHSLPLPAAAASGPDGGGYVAALRLGCLEVAARLDGSVPWDLVFQSRSGPPSLPWLGPDISDHLEVLAAGGHPAVVVAPLGFLSDNAEVVYDLDVVARARAAELGLGFSRAATVGVGERFVAALSSVVVERLGGEPAPGRGAPYTYDVCPPGCCLPR